MYGKVFQSMYDGTLATRGPWQALVTFQQMIVLADKDGVVDKTAGAISRITSIPLEIIEVGLEELAKPDPDSRSEDEDGKRIVLLEPHRNWGWQIVNYVKYAAIRSAEERREYMRNAQAKHRAKKASITKVDNVDCLSMSIVSTHVPVPVPVDVKRLHPTDVVVEDDSYRVPNCPHKEILAIYHEKLPMLPKVRVLSNIRMKHTQARWKQVCAAEKFSLQDALDWFGWYFGRVAESKFLTGRISGHDGRVWQADFEWLMNGSSFAKVIEGRYHQ